MKTSEKEFIRKFGEIDYTECMNTWGTVEGVLMYDNLDNLNEDFTGNEYFSDVDDVFNFFEGLTNKTIMTVVVATGDILIKSDLLEEDF